MDLVNASVFGPCHREADIKDHLFQIPLEDLDSLAGNPTDIFSLFPPDLGVHLGLCESCLAGSFVVGLLLSATGGQVIWVEEEADDV